MQGDGYRTSRHIKRFILNELEIHHFPLTGLQSLYRLHDFIEQFDDTTKRSRKDIAVNLDIVPGPVIHFFTSSHCW